MIRMPLTRASGIYPVFRACTYSAFPVSSRLFCNQRSVAWLTSIASASSQRLVPQSHVENRYAAFGLSRSFWWFGRRDSAQHSAQHSAGPHQAFLALGSNMGDRFHMIETACKMMGERGISVRRTSGLYETKPMYVEDQPKFLNGVCEVTTELGPEDLLAAVKDIESSLGRVKTIDNGPRSIDIDILMYGDETIQLDQLQVPHPRIREREFVLRPLCDLAPDCNLPGDNQTFKDHLRVSWKAASNSLQPLTLLKSGTQPLVPDSSFKSTMLMAVVNLTPDSFSDGGVHSASNPTKVLSKLQTLLPPSTEPPLILDIGGQSTRPKAAMVSPEDELSRILPTIQAIRRHPAFASAIISVDTFRASVAEAAINAGAHLVNDVSGGTLDPEMLPTIARLGCSCILGHMRGDPSTMASLSDYPGRRFHNILAAELIDRVSRAQDAGIRRWRILLDPGIGFAKKMSHNLLILRDLSRLRRDYEGLKGFAWVVGPSRKGFIGNITGLKEPRDRIIGTAVCLDAAVRGGADVVRVHDVREMGEAVKMADAIWRTWFAEIP